ncbi:hypothetical protein AB0O91_32110 [Kitasatospora sp. NPDC089797]|uniref:hypothetical protein n=1 Tax=Kitasatospora sp. NPDC089797 TaxID=3155298 RepID=UPI00341CE006
MSIAFVRRADGLVYRYRREGEFNGRPAFKRLDLDVWCRWLPGRGWCTVGADGTANGWPLSGRSGQGAFPPLGPLFRIMPDQRAALGARLGVPADRPRTGPYLDDSPVRPGGMPGVARPA